MRLSPRCYAVTGLGYSTPWCVNAGFVVGDHTTLVVDTGSNALAAATVHGYATMAKLSNRLQVINTEKHFDHIGGNGYFQARGAELWGHPEIARTPEEFAGEIEEFNDGISNRARRERGEARCFFHGTLLTNPDHPISADIRFDLGGCEVEVLMTPGHTPTNISVWVPSEEVAYTGDCLIAEYLANLDAGSPADWRQWLSSLDRIAALNAQIVMAGHGPVARGPEVTALIANVRGVLEESLARGCSPTAAVFNSKQVR
jgi:glyoxylase-like metal-dependent hydrolase (beta-lactamase superfamily II)